jgi:Uma2 family endonuclease
MTETKPYSFADLLRRLGGIPPERIRMTPAPGTATEKDLRRAGKPICELIDGVLVEKAMGTSGSMLGAYILRLIGNFEEQRDLGIVLGGDGYIRIRKGLVRVPDVTFIPWSSLRKESCPKKCSGPSPQD